MYIIYTSHIEQCYICVTKYMIEEKTTDGLQQTKTLKNIYNQNNYKMKRAITLLKRNMRKP